MPARTGDHRHISRDIHNDFARHFSAHDCRPRSWPSEIVFVPCLFPFVLAQMGAPRCCRRMVRIISSANNSTRALATEAHLRRQPQTLIEKVVQKYAVGWPKDKAVKAGDYVMIQPEHVMSHDNTGPVISK